MASIHYTDIGTELVVAVVDESGVAVDISTATTLTIFLKPPAGAALRTKTGVLDTTGVDGLMKYVTVAGDLDPIGEWVIQGYVVLTSSQKWFTDVSKFVVIGNLS